MYILFPLGIALEKGLCPPYNKMKYPPLVAVFSLDGIRLLSLFPLGAWTEVDAGGQIERPQDGGKSAGFRTRRDARYNRAVVPWWWRRTDRSSGDSQWGGHTKTIINPQPGAETQFPECARAGGRGGTEADSSACTGGKTRRDVNNMPVCPAGLPVPGFALDGLSRPRGLLLPLLPLPASTGPCCNADACVIALSALGYEAASQTFVLLPLGSDIFVWWWRPCLISPQPAV